MSPMSERLFVGVFLVCAALLHTLALAAQDTTATAITYKPAAVEVTDGVYAIIGPLDQRSVSNAGLNANYGLIETKSGVILIDSGPSMLAAAMLEEAVLEITAKPIKWVLNTGSQDHRWLGNGYFEAKGAQIHALHATVQTQQQNALRQIEGMRRFVGDQMTDTDPTYATATHFGEKVELTIDETELIWMTTNAHYPGDTMIYLPRKSVVFSGDLVYVDRLMGVLPQSDVRQGLAAFERLVALSPQAIVPGHGPVADIPRAQAETGDYYRFLINNVGQAARIMSPMAETLDRFAKPAAFQNLKNFDELHRANMNRVFLDFESNP